VQNIDGCTFEEDSCGFTGLSWVRESTSPNGLHYDNTFRVTFGKLLLLLLLLLLLCVSCGLTGLSWAREPTSAHGLHYDNMFNVAFGECLLWLIYTAMYCIYYARLRADCTVAVQR